MADPEQSLRLVYAHQQDAAVFCKLLCVSKYFQASQSAAGRLTISISTRSISRVAGNSVQDKVAHIVRWLAKHLDQGRIKYLSFCTSEHDDDVDLLSCRLSQLLSSVVADPARRHLLPETVIWEDSRHGLYWGDIIQGRNTHLLFVRPQAN
jgi:hypothetical protein